MRLSCNGCRVLRKGCSPDCPIRPCLNWIDSPASQANATFFLAKFYGRAGLLNLLTAAPQQLQPSVFKSLLYEACGRIVNPIFGSTGLLSTGSWHLCEAAVNAVLIGTPIQQALSDSSCDNSTNLQLQACDIRHIAKSGRSCDLDQLQGVKTRTSQFKRRAKKPNSGLEKGVVELVAGCSGKNLEGSVSRDSESGVSEHRSIGGEADSRSFECVEPARVDDQQLELELTLGWGSTKISRDASLV